MLKTKRSLQKMTNEKKCLISVTWCLTWRKTLLKWKFILEKHWRLVMRFCGAFKVHLIQHHYALLTLTPSTNIRHGCQQNQTVVTNSFSLFVLIKEKKNILSNSRRCRCEKKKSFSSERSLRVYVLRSSEFLL